MKAYHILTSLAGSLIIYVALAACSSDGGQNGHGGHGGQAGTGGLDSGIIDALLDPVSEASAEPTAGSRLKGMYETGEDGSKAYFPGQWWDSKRGEECSRGMATDGKERCLPTSKVPLDTSNVYYMDATCKGVHLWWYKHGCAPAYNTVDMGPNNTCSGAPVPTTQEFHKLTMVSIPTIYSLNAQSQCVGQPTQPTVDYFQIGPALSPDEFVVMTTGHD